MTDNQEDYRHPVSLQTEKDLVPVRCHECKHWQRFTGWVSRWGTCAFLGKRNFPEYDDDINGNHIPNEPLQTGENFGCIHGVRN